MTAPTESKRSSKPQQPTYNTSTDRSSTQSVSPNLIAKGETPGKQVSISTSGGRTLTNLTTSRELESTPIGMGQISSKIEDYENSPKCVIFHRDQMFFIDRILLPNWKADWKNKAESKDLPPCLQDKYRSYQIIPCEEIDVSLIGTKKTLNKIRNEALFHSTAAEEINRLPLKPPSKDVPFVVTYLTPIEMMSEYHYCTLKGQGAIVTKRSNKVTISFDEKRESEVRGNIEKDTANFSLNKNELSKAKFVPKAEKEWEQALRMSATRNAKKDCGKIQREQDEVKALADIKAAREEWYSACISTEEKTKNQSDEIMKMKCEAKFLENARTDKTIHSKYVFCPDLGILFFNNKYEVISALKDNQHPLCKGICSKTILMLLDDECWDSFLYQLSKKIDEKILPSSEALDVEYFLSLTEPQKKIYATIMTGVGKTFFPQADNRLINLISSLSLSLLKLPTILEQIASVEKKQLSNINDIYQSRIAKKEVLSTAREMANPKFQKDLEGYKWDSEKIAKIGLQPPT